MNRPSKGAFSINTKDAGAPHILPDVLLDRCDASDHDAQGMIFHGLLGVFKKADQLLRIFQHLIGVQIKDCLLYTSRCV